jgi:hypothetical protein
MRSKSESEIRADLEAVKERLAEIGKDVTVGSDATLDGGVKFDFDLPYSTMAPLKGSQWSKQHMLP